VPQRSFTGRARPRGPTVAADVGRYSWEEHLERVGTLANIFDQPEGGPPAIVAICHGWDESEFRQWHDGGGRWTRSSIKADSPMVMGRVTNKNSVTGSGGLMAH
jgi:hypothetical protein